MEYQIIPPPVHLLELVQCFWTLESNPNEHTPRDYFLMADSCPEIIFQYNEGFQTYSAQSARMRFQHSVHGRFDVGKKLGFFGVRLHPHAVSQLLNIPASELVNQVFDFLTLFKQEGRDLADQVYSQNSPAERIASVTNFLTKRISIHKADPIKYFVDQVIQRSGFVDIPKMQRASGLSLKQFERRFKAIAGFSPKYFARIARFQSLKDKYRSSRFPTLTSLAHSCNYYDQSHFNKEFKEFSGVPPLKYFRLIEQEDGDLFEHAGDVQIVNGRRRFDGYLPCGWFV